MRRACFPGTFDPPTLGHIDIISRAARLFDELIIVIAENPQKKRLFSAEECRILLEQALGTNAPGRNSGAITIEICDYLVARFMAERNAGVLVRGIRGSDDFPYEFDVSTVNQRLNPNIDTVFLLCDPKYRAARSSTVKHLAGFGADISWLVPPNVEAAVQERINPS